jgi:hypothetical protein
VVGEEDEGVEPPGARRDDALQAEEKVLAVVVIADDVLAAVAPGHEVVEGVQVWNVQKPGLTPTSPLLS